MESKSEKYFRILKSLKYPDIDSLNPKMFDYLFLIPETQKFFDWFLENVDESCLVNDAVKYMQMLSEGQVIQDIEKIREINKLISSSSSSNDLKKSKDGDEWLEKSLPDDEELLEKMLQTETEAYERDVKRVEREKETHRKFKKIGLDTMRRLQKTELDRQTYLERLHEKDESLKSLNKITNQNLHKSEIEFQTKFCDETYLNARLDELESFDQCDGYVQQEKKFIRRLNEMSLFEPRLPYASNASSSEIMNKSNMYADVNNIIWKSFLDKRLFYRCTESDLKELKFFVDNFDSIVKFGSNQESDNELRAIFENEIQNNGIQKQVIYQKNKTFVRELLADAYAAFRLRELDWKMSELKQRYISLSLFRSNQEKYVKLLNSLRTRRNFVQDVMKSKLGSIETIGELLEEILTANQNAANMAAGCLPPPQMSSTHSAAAAAALASGGGGHQSPSKSNGENQFIHILNQYLISTLRRLNNDLNRSACDNDEFELKSQISTSFNINLDTFIDLAERIRGKFSVFSSALSNNSKSFELTFNSSFDTISKAIRYIYDQKIQNRIDLSRATTIPRMPKPLDEKIKMINKEREELHSMFMVIFQALHSYKNQLAEDELKRLKRELFVYFYVAPKQIENLIQHLNNL